MLRHWDERPLPDLLAAHGLSETPEAPFPNDGWSGATLTQLADGDRRRILKRTSWSQDWIARATRDHALREGFVATGQLPLPESVVAPYLGAAADGTVVAMLMPDLSRELISWERDDGAPTVDVATLDRVLRAIADLHATPLDVVDDDWPWCPIGERLVLLAPSSAVRFDADGVAAGRRFLEGWAAFADHAPPAAVDLISRLDADPGPLLDALELLPPALLHGDLKLANVAPLEDGRTALIDWQMVMAAPVAVDLGWFLVSNSAALPIGPEAVLGRYRAAADRAGGGAGGDAGWAAGWAATRDLAILAGLLLRGWRKGLDTRDGRRVAWGVPASTDLAWWCAAALEAADRRF